MKPHISTFKKARFSNLFCLSCFSVTDRKDNDSSIHGMIPRNKGTIASASCKLGAKRSLPSTHCNETFAGDSTLLEDTEHSRVNQAKASKAEAPAVKPLNAYNYFYSEIREGILQLSKAELEMLILNNNKHHVENKHNSCPGRNDTPCQPGSLAQTILLKQNARFSKAERKRVLLSKHWNKDRTTRRKHRTKHGKMSFNHMNTLVSTEWKFLPESQKMFYKEVAEADCKRYKEQKEH